MAFLEDVVKKAWQRAGGRCECKRESHNHYGRCDKILVWDARGRELTGAWEAHHITSQASDGGDGISNCEILCWACHKQTI